MTNKKIKFEPVWDIRSNDGKVTEGNEWAKDLAEKIGKECIEHGKGFVFCPFGGSNMTCKSFFATSLTEPVVFASAISMMLANYMRNNPMVDKSERVKLLNTVIDSAMEIIKGYENGEID